jgi:hypothetical protein
MQQIGLKIRFINHSIKENEAIFNPFKSANRLEYAKFNKDSILASSTE